MVRRDPWLLGHQHNRWTLEAVRQSCPWLRLDSDSGLWRLFDRLGISYKRGRHYTHSPDPFYQPKRGYIAERRQGVENAPDRLVLLYLDECSYYRKPTLAKAYEARGHHQMLAPLGRKGHDKQRIIGTLEARTGRVCYAQHAQIGVEQVLAFYQQIVAAYPQAETIYVVVDNWPVHFHAEIIGHLERQQWPWPFLVPPTWPALPEGPVVSDPLPVQLLCLPTYASWLNPIEKLWRWLKQQVVHLHRLSDQWAALKERVSAFLGQFDDGSTELLRYVGLLPN